MTSKFQQTIKLMQKNEEGKYKPTSFKSAEFLPGNVSEEASVLQQKMIDAENGDEVIEALHDVYDFIGEVIFEGQFTGEEYRRGLDAREIAPLTGKILKSVTTGFDATYSDQKKK